jgi:hypothetical protein
VGHPLEGEGVDPEAPMSVEKSLRALLCVLEY